LVAALDGQRELFKGLWIDDSDYDFKPRPTIHLNLEDWEPNTAAETKKLLLKAFKAQADSFGVELTDEKNPAYLFANLVRDVHDKHGKLAVIVEGYDAPAMRFLEEPEKAQDVWSALKGFYHSLGHLAHYGLVLIIGEYNVAFDQASDRSKVEDLSFHPRFEDAFGFTVEEFDRNFADSLKQMAKEIAGEKDLWLSASAADLRELILTWYADYSWDGSTKLLNPYSVVECFRTKQFAPHWFNATKDLTTGFLTKNPPDTQKLLSKDVGISSLSKSVRFEALIPEVVMFHHGYLAIDHYVSKDTWTGLKLFPPNLEIRSTVLSSLLNIDFSMVSAKEAHTMAVSFLRALMDYNGPDMDEIYRDYAYVVSLPRVEGAFPLHKNLIFFIFAMAGQGLQTAETPFFDYALELPHDPDDANHDIRFVALRIRNTTDPLDNDREVRAVYSKLRLQKTFRENFCQRIPERRIKVSSCLIRYNATRDGIQSTVTRY
jgi:hypothetical protein